MCELKKESVGLQLKTCTNNLNFLSCSWEKRKLISLYARSESKICISLDLVDGASPHFFSLSSVVVCILGALLSQASTQKNSIWWSRWMGWVLMGRMQMQELLEVCSGWVDPRAAEGEDERPPSTELCCAVDGLKGHGEVGIQAGTLALQKALLVSASWMAEWQSYTAMPLKLLVLRKPAMLNHSAISMQCSPFTCNTASLFCSQRRGWRRRLNVHRQLLLLSTSTKGKCDLAKPQGKEYLPQTGISLPF